MKKVLAILVVFICFEMNTNAQYCKLAYISSVQVITNPDDTTCRCVIVSVLLTSEGHSMLDRGFSITMSISANFIDAEKHLMQMTQQSNFMGIDHIAARINNNRAIDNNNCAKQFGLYSAFKSESVFECKTYESAKFLQDTLSKSDFTITCY